jgi:glutamine amidotransferase-like uncharacterized protein
LLFAHALATSPSARAALALVYGGPGTENYEANGSMAAAAQAARTAGFDVQIVTAMPPEESWAGASVWIQPGGENFVQARDMKRTGVFERVKQFVASGGGYVGFCAGAFMAQSDNSLGLGLVPGQAYRYSKGAFKAKVMWNGQLRYIHYENGPQLVPEPGFRVFATYASNGAPAAGEGRYGAGRVVISGVHPEALPDWWPTRDPDGPDVELAAQMIREASRH